MTPYWPWWGGALALGGIATAHAYFAGSLLGVSGKVARIAYPKESLQAERAEADVAMDPEAFRAALLAATQEEFGGDVQGESSSSKVEQAFVPSAPSEPPAIVEGGKVPNSLHLSASVAFLAAVVVGGFLASFMRGDFAIRRAMPFPHVHFVGNGPLAMALLLVGGVFVGFGTRMAGGCTSGHGLSGCARFSPKGLIATACFVGTGVLTALVVRSALP